MNKKEIYSSKVALLFFAAVFLSPIMTSAAPLTQAQSLALINVVKSSPETPASAFTDLITTFSNITIKQAESLIGVVQASPDAPSEPYVNMLVAFTEDSPKEELGGKTPQENELNQNADDLQKRGGEQKTITENSIEESSPEESSGETSESTSAVIGDIYIKRHHPEYPNSPAIVAADITGPSLKKNNQNGKTNYRLICDTPPGGGNLSEFNAHTFGEFYIWEKTYGRGTYSCTVYLNPVISEEYEESVNEHGTTVRTPVRSVSGYDAASPNSTFEL